MAEKTEASEPEPNNTLPLRAALSHIFTNIGDSVSDKQFAECQCFLRSKLSEAKFNSTIHKLRTTIAKDLYDSMNEELEGMMTEESLINGLGRLKQLLMETPYSPGEIAWRPPGDVGLHLRTFDVSRIDEEAERLTKLVDDLEDENDHLMKIISKKRQETLALDKKITKSTKIGINSIAKLEKTKDRIQKCVDELGEAQIDNN